MPEELLPFLRRNPGLFYCALCLARESRVPLRELAEAWAHLVTHKAVQITEGHCTQCMLVRTVARVHANGTAAA
jgi:hypothetical protein